MCVIICCEDEYPKAEIIQQAEQWNEDGGGMAWVSNGKVHYKKGITGKDMLDIIKKRKVKLPFICHFRIATVGKSCKELCHPFPIEDGVPLKTSGVCDEILFHNGSWTDWREWIHKTLIRKQIKMPRGVWSDSRGMAFLSYHYGREILSTLGTGKIAVLTKDGIERYGSDTWVKVGKLACSNDTFERTETETVWTSDDEDENETWAKDFAKAGVLGYEGFWSKGGWHSKKDKDMEKISLSQTVDMSVEEEIIKGIKEASKEEIKDDSTTTDEIARNAIRKGIEERMDHLPVLPDTNPKEIKVKKMENYISTKEFIDKYDNISDEAIQKEYYDHMNFREKHEHKEEETGRRGAVNQHGIGGYNGGQYDRSRDPMYQGYME